MNEYRLDGEFANTTNHVSFIFLDFLYLKSILLCFLILFIIYGINSHGFFADAYICFLIFMFNNKKNKKNTQCKISI